MTSRVLSMVVLLSLAACSGGKESPGSQDDGGAGGGRCSNDPQCGAGRVCLAGMCASRAGAVPGWAIEVRPADYGSAAITERTTIDPSGDITADRSVAVTVAFVGTVESPVPTTANVVISVPSAIPGRPELTFETGTSTTPGAAMLALPAGVLSRGAKVRLIPAPPADQQSPPYLFVIPPQTSTDVRLTIPGGNPWIHGTLHDAVDDVPMRPFVARAYQDGRLVSNVPTIMAKSPSNQMPAADGGFSLTVPAAIVSSPITIELSPQGPSASDPWFTRAPLTLPPNSQSSTEIGIIKLPVYQVPQPFQIAVHGDDVGQPAMSNTLVRALTGFTPQADGTARFLRDGLTDATGAASLSLIPGTASAGRTYQFAVVPPAGAAFASLCVPESVVAGGTTSQLPAITLPRRKTLSGVITSAAGVPIADVTVTASRDPATATVCAATGLTSTTNRTDMNGKFALALDPGVYQVDYDPPTGSAAPRQTEFDVDVSGDVSRQVQLPVGALFEGDVHDPDGKPLQYATVRIFEPRCVTAGCTPPPRLRAEALSDADGHYRVVAAVPSGN